MKPAHPTKLRLEFPWDPFPAILGLFGRFPRPSAPIRQLEQHPAAEVGGWVWLEPPLRLGPLRLEKWPDWNVLVTRQFFLKELADPLKMKCSERFS